MPTNSNAPLISIAGDIVVDWNIAESKTNHADSWSPSKTARLQPARGGALLIADLLSALLAAAGPNIDPTPAVQGADLSLDSLHPGDPGLHHAFNLLAPFKAKAGQIWRVDRFLGFDRSDDQASATSPSFLSANANLLIIDDANLGFRQARDTWLPLLEALDEDSWVLLKQSAPVAHGELWSYLLEKHAQQLITVTTIDDLRRSEVQISRQISWERTAQDVYWELAHNPRVNSLSRSAHCLISMNAAGAILLSNLANGEGTAKLLFDPHNMECGYEESFAGSVYGYTTCLSAAVALELTRDIDSPNLANGIQAGVRGMRALLAAGFGQGELTSEGDQLSFPFEPVAAAILDQRDLLAAAPIQNPVKNLVDPAPPDHPRVMPGYWTLLEDRYTRDLSQLAQRIVLDGVDAALQDVPVGQFGALKTVDRREIEALHSIRGLIGEYLRRPPARPLSIAVFGPPGSGKSFAVKQIAKSTAAGEIRSITFNISQFDHPDALLDALHQVRDIALSGAVPLVFWDEFDTPFEGKPLGWLRYFLAPMQDGSFQEGQITHPIGQAIFVFAGGTSHRMETFGAGLEEIEQRAAKLPDFISRLKGFINILGPNPIEGIDDPYFIIRRAIILRVLFEMHIPQIFTSSPSGKRARIDAGILRAFLETDRYKHGVRSMETILTMSSLSEAQSFERSCLPPEDQLNLHVDGTDFLARVQQLELDEQVLESLARAAHEVFCEGLEEQGFKYGPVTDNDKKTHRALMDYAELGDELKESNRANVRDIPTKLAQAGYAMLPARSNEPPFNFPGSDLERLAQQEHARWMEAKSAAGWEYGAELDTKAKKHPAMVPWEKLDEHEREKDRQMVRSIPRILARAGYAVVPRRPQPTE